MNPQPGMYPVRMDVSLRRGKRKEVRKNALASVLRGSPSALLLKLLSDRRSGCCCWSVRCVLVSRLHLGLFFFAFTRGLSDVATPDNIEVGPGVFCDCNLN